MNLRDTSMSTLSPCTAGTTQLQFLWWALHPQTGECSPLSGAQGKKSCLDQPTSREADHFNTSGDRDGGRNTQSGPTLVKSAADGMTRIRVQSHVCQNHSRYRSSLTLAMLMLSPMRPMSERARSHISTWWSLPLTSTCSPGVQAVSGLGLGLPLLWALSHSGQRHPSEKLPLVCTAPELPREAGVLPADEPGWSCVQISERQYV